MASAVERPDNVLPQRPNDFEKNFWVGLYSIDGKIISPLSSCTNKSLCLVDVKLYMGAPVAAFPNRKNGISEFSPRNSICYSQPCKFHHMGS